MVFKGYIDESYDGQQKLFALSCMVSYGKHLSEMERKWRHVLRSKNRQLQKQGRPLISRYHATDCNARQGEFRGWSNEERDEFVLNLFGIFKQTHTHTVGIDVDLEDLCEVFPEFANDRLELAYRLMLDFVMLTVVEDFYKLNPAREDWRVALFHDRTANGKYDPSLHRQFDVTKHSASLGRFFTSITSMTWEECVLLQPADLVAFEVFREARRNSNGQRSRKSFDALIDMESFGIHTRSFVSVVFWPSLFWEGSVQLSDLVVSTMLGSGHD